VAELRRGGQLDNTVIIFLQDNGACAEENGRKPPKADPPTQLKPMARDELQLRGRRFRPAMAARCAAGPG
jgi:arylsulfatase